MHDVDKHELRQDYENRLKHTVVAYRYLASAIPDDSMFVGGKQLFVGSFHFRKQNDAMSMRVELGWAFFVRLEAILEAFVNRLGINVSRNRSLLDHLVEHGVEFTDDQAKGLRQCRELRNTLHHGDGDPSLLKRKPEFVRIKPGHEPHLLEEHIERFFDLFLWLGRVLPNTVST